MLCALRLCIVRLDHSKSSHIAVAQFSRDAIYIGVSGATVQNSIEMSWHSSRLVEVRKSHNMPVPAEVIGDRHGNSI
jgi:hypothetical protein